MQTMDSLPEFDRASDLGKFISKLREKTDRGGTTWATTEYATARTEHDEVLKAIDTRRTSMLTEAKAAVTPASPLKVTNLQVEDVDFVTGSKALGWAKG